MAKRQGSYTNCEELLQGCALHHTEATTGIGTPIVLLMTIIDVHLSVCEKSENFVSQGTVSVVRVHYLGAGSIALSMGFPLC
jgi:hypothetical protein